EVGRGRGEIGRPKAGYHEGRWPVPFAGPVGETDVPDSVGAAEFHPRQALAVIAVGDHDEVRAQLQHFFGWCRGNLTHLEDALVLFLEPSDDTATDGPKLLDGVQPERPALHTRGYLHVAAGRQRVGGPGPEKLTGPPRNPLVGGDEYDRHHADAPTPMPAVACRGVRRRRPEGGATQPRGHAGQPPGEPSAASTCPLGGGCGRSV